MHTTSQGEIFITGSLWTSAFFNNTIMWVYFLIHQYCHKNWVWWDWINWPLCILFYQITHLFLKELEGIGSPGLHILQCLENQQPGKEDWGYLWTLSCLCYGWCIYKRENAAERWCFSFQLNAAYNIRVEVSRSEQVQCCDQWC